MLLVDLTELRDAKEHPLDLLTFRMNHRFDMLRDQLDHRFKMVEHQFKLAELEAENVRWRDRLAALIVLQLVGAIGAWLLQARYCFFSSACQLRITSSWTPVPGASRIMRNSLPPGKTSYCGAPSR